MEKTVAFERIFKANFAEKMIGKKLPISRGFSGQISLEGDWFRADLRRGLNETRRS